MHRGIAAIILNYFIVNYYSINSYFKSKRDLKVLNLRNVIMVFHGFSIVYALYYLQAPIVYTINNMGPICVFAIDKIKNKKTINKK